jgi:hypothetical protein
VNSKEHVLRLALVEKELRLLPDAELAKLVAACPEEAQRWMIAISGSDDETLSVEGLRGALKRGRMKGLPDKAAATLTDTCLHDCIEALGDKADLPSEADLMGVTAALAAKHGVGTTRLMLAAAALAEAPAANAIVKVLKNDPSLALPTLPASV